MTICGRELRTVRCSSSPPSESCCPATCACRGSGRTMYPARCTSRVERYGPSLSGFLQLPWRVRSQPFQRLRRSRHPSRPWHSHGLPPRRHSTDDAHPNLRATRTCRTGRWRESFSPRVLSLGVLVPTSRNCADRSRGQLDCEWPQIETAPAKPDLDARLDRLTRSTAEWSVRAGEAGIERAEVLRLLDFEAPTARTDGSTI